jgi:NDP-sugar pyrophosphorylase family protein
MAPVVILAGGLGTRVRAQSGALPKSLVDVAGAPFVAHQLRRLGAQGVRRVVFCVGHQGDQIACDLATVYQEMLRQGQLAALEVLNRFYEVGSPAGLEEIRQHLHGGVPAFRETVP